MILRIRAHVQNGVWVFWVFFLFLFLLLLLINVEPFHGQGLRTQQAAQGYPMPGGLEGTQGDAVGVPGDTLRPLEGEGEGAVCRRAEFSERSRGPPLLPTSQKQQTMLSRKQRLWLPLVPEAGVGPKLGSWLKKQHAIVMETDSGSLTHGSFTS